MKKTCAILWCLVVTALLAGACNYDAECWAPGEGQGAGVGGGVITPGAGGGYGAEPDPEPQGDPDNRWRCTGHPIDCMNETDPTVRSCLYVTAYGETKEAAIAWMLQQCTEALAISLGKIYVCESVEDLVCKKLPKISYTCSGTPRCKRGTACKTPDATWYSVCESVDVPVTDNSPELARQQLLDQCEDDLESMSTDPWFCMPGSLKCEAD